MADGFLAFNVFKPFDQWVRHPLCVVSLDELRKRIASGMKPETALTTPIANPQEDRRQKAARLSREYEGRLSDFHRPKNNPRFKRHSPFIGVSRHKNGKFYAQIRDERAVRHLGYFVSEVEAALAYDEEAKRLGKRRLNFG